MMKKKVIALTLSAALVCISCAVPVMAEEPPCSTGEVVTETQGDVFNTGSPNEGLYTEEAPPAEDPPSEDLPAEDPQPENKFNVVRDGNTIKVTGDVDLKLTAKKSYIYISVVDDGGYSIDLFDEKNGNYLKTDIYSSKQSNGHWFTPLYRFRNKETDYCIYPIGGAEVSIRLIGGGTDCTLDEKLVIPGGNTVFEDKNSCKEYILKRALKEKKKNEFIVLCRKTVDYVSTDELPCEDQELLRNMYVVSFGKLNVDGEPYNVVYTMPGITKRLRRDYNKADIWLDKARKKCKKSSVTGTVKAVNSYICSHAKYDYKVYNALSGRGKVSRRRVDLSGGTFGIPLKGRAVCAGYAATTSALLNRCGVKAVVISNNIHAWTLVKKGSKWYHLDTCWNDTGGVSNKYTMRGSKYIRKLRGHKIPARFSKKYNISSTDL